MKLPNPSITSLVGALLLFLAIAGSAVEPIALGLWATNIAPTLDAGWLVGDFNNDGRIDLIIHGDPRNDSQAKEATLLTNWGDGRFVVSYRSHRFTAAAFAAGDWNNDGKLDLLRAAVQNSAITVQTNSTFLDVVSLSTHRKPSWLDFDADGDLDAFTLPERSGRASLGIREQKEGGQFVDVRLERDLPLGGGIVKGDFNSDGRMDWVILPLDHTNRLVLYLNSGSTRWTQSEVLLPLHGYVQGGVAVDVDNDGRTDLLLNLQYALLFARNTGSSFDVKRINVPEYHYTSLAAGDLNNDGFVDFAVPAGIYLNEGGTNFQRAEVPFDMNESTLADFNGDGSLDVLVKGCVPPGHSTFLIFTNAASPPRPVRPPTNPQPISKTPQAAEFTWEPPAGGNGFTYNIGLGTTPGGVEIVSPHSDLDSGARRIVEGGNAGPGGVYRIERLAPGQYYWRVQAVNQAFVGSGFTEEQSFTHTTVPLFYDILVTNVTRTSATLHVEMNSGGLETTCHMEYGTDPQNVTKVLLSRLPGTAAHESITQQLTGLRERSSYFYRIIAVNGNGTNESVGAFQTELFSRRVLASQTGAAFPILLEVGDLNADGHMEFIANGGEHHAATVYANAAGAFRPVLSLWTNVTLARLFDWNNDGKLDICAIEPYHGSDGRPAERVHLALNTETGLVYRAFPLGDFQASTPPDKRDMDNDGVDDLLILEASRLLVFWGEPGGDFYQPPTVLSPTASTFVTGDFDNNGFIDVLIGKQAWSDYSYELLSNAGRREFQRTHHIDSMFGVHLSGFTDFDQDGWLDIYFHGQGAGGTGTSWLLSNNAGQDFTDVVFDQKRILSQGFGWGDFDLDGLPDSLIAGASPTASPTSALEGVLITQKNLGIRRFAPTVLWREGPAGEKFLRAQWIDADQDGDLDIVVLSRGTDSLTLHENLIDPVSLPGSPRQLVSAISGSGVRLGWEQPAQPTSTGLSYNVRVGTAPGNADVINPLTVPSTGKLLLHKMGNAELRRFSILTNLPAGNYFWSVQSVDSAYRGSDFAPEQKFTISQERTPLHLELIYQDRWCLSISGQRGRKFALEESHDLHGWSSMSTNALTTWTTFIPVNALESESAVYFRIRSIE